jgi:hypothetical protein
MIELNNLIKLINELKSAEEIDFLTEMLNALRRTNPKDSLYPYKDEKFYDETMKYFLSRQQNKIGGRKSKIEEIKVYIKIINENEPDISRKELQQKLIQNNFALSTINKTLKQLNI